MSTKCNKKILGFSLLILVALLFTGIDLSYAECSTELMGIYRFGTREAFDNFWLLGGGQPIAETDGKVFVTDAMVGLAISYQDAQDQEAFGWNFIEPDGSLKNSGEITYNMDTDCWVESFVRMWCGDPENPYFIDGGWIYGISITGEQLGVWTIEFLKNGQLVYSENFELVARVLDSVSGNKQEVLPCTTIPEPITVKLLDFYGSGLSDSPITFTITDQPKGAKGAGLTETYNDPPLGAENTSITVNTDTNGIAKVYLELGNKSGLYTVTASSPNADVGSPQVFTEYAAELTVGDIEMSVEGDVSLPGEIDPFFIANFDEQGNIIVLKNAPIGGLVNDNFDLNIFLNAYPGNPSWNPLTEWKWQIQGLGGPTKGTSFEDWDTTETITPEVSSPTTRYFGDHDFKIDFTFKDIKGSRINTQKEVVNLKLFFKKYGDYDNNGIPNWYEYWSESSASIGNHKYDAETPYYGYYPHGEHYFYIGYIASGKNDQTEHMGIDCFAETVIHENTHMTDYLNWWPKGYDENKDLDRDKIPDNIEPSLGFDPTKPDTDGDREIDFEDRGYDAEWTWKAGSANQEDWSCPGKQTEPAY
jgi:hypothetical protein